MQNPEKSLVLKAIREATCVEFDELSWDVCDQMIRHQQLINKTFDQVCREVLPMPFRLIFQPPPKSSLPSNVDSVTHLYFTFSIDIWIDEFCFNISQSCDRSLFLPCGRNCNSNLYISDRSNGDWEPFTFKLNFNPHPKSHLSNDACLLLSFDYISPIDLWIRESCVSSYDPWSYVLLVPHDHELVNIFESQTTETPTYMCVIFDISLFWLLTISIRGSIMGFGS